MTFVKGIKFQQITDRVSVSVCVCVHVFTIYLRPRVTDLCQKTQVGGTQVTAAVLETLTPLHLSVCLSLSLSLITQPEKAASKAYLARSLGLSFGDTLSEGEKGHEHRIRECMKRVDRDQKRGN